MKPFRPTPKYPKNPRRMTDVELNSAWEELMRTIRPRSEGGTEEEYQFLHRMELEIRRRPA